MNWRETLATQRAHSDGKGPGCVLTKPTKGTSGSFGSMQDARLPTKTASATIRARLLALAEFECLEPALVHRLDDADVMTCAGESDETLTAYLRALDAAARMDAGMAPTGWTAARYCRLCGPVLLWPGCPPIVQACPWCFRRKAGRYVPRPQVQCADCVHFIRNELNPAGGGGDCAKDRGGHWPMQRHRCAEWRTSFGD